MRNIDRPTQITTILSTICTGDAAESGAELEAYIADLEAKQPHRPTRITAILRTIGSQYPAGTGILLEEYISNLEAKQQAMQPSDRTPSRDPNNPPVWSHQRSVQRAQQRREHALKMRNYYR
jgi:hypothetical protein